MILELAEQIERRWRPLENRLRFERSVERAYRPLTDSPLLRLLPGPRQSSEPVPSSVERAPTEALAHELVGRVREGSTSVRQLAREYRPRMEQLGLLREDSQE